MQAAKHSIEIELIGVGRKQFSGKVIVKNPSMYSVRKAIQPHLASKGWDLEETETPTLYNVVCGFRSSGQVKIAQDHWLLLI